MPTPKLRIDGDLLELRDLSPWNSGYNYSLVLIDAFTRYVWSKILKTKESRAVAKAFEELHSENPEALTPLYIYTDAGREFVGAPFQSALRQRGIEHRIGSSEEFHCPFVERVIRTIKEKLFQAMTSEHTRRWIDLLPRIVDTYNKTTHSAIGMEPEEASRSKNYLKALEQTYPIKTSSMVAGTAVDGMGRGVKRYRFKKGDLVRILKAEGGAIKSKGYLPNFSWEIFRVRTRANTKPHDKLRGRPPAYILEDLEGELIENAVFYEEELVRVHPDQISGAFPVREILDQRRVRGRGKGKEKEEEEVLVWFQGHSKKDARWIPRSQLTV